MTPLLWHGDVCFAHLVHPGDSCEDMHVDMCRDLCIHMHSSSAAIAVATISTALSCSMRSRAIAYVVQISWATYRIFTCENPVMWMKAEVKSAGQKLAFTMGTPVLERLKEIKMTAVFIGPSADLPFHRPLVSCRRRTPSVGTNLGRNIRIASRRRVITPPSPLSCNPLAFEMPCFEKKTPARAGLASARQTK